MMQVLSPYLNIHIRTNASTPHVYILPVLLSSRIRSSTLVRPSESRLEIGTQPECNLIDQSFTCLVSTL